MDHSVHDKSSQGDFFTVLVGMYRSRRSFPGRENMIYSKIMISTYLVQERCRRKYSIIGCPNYGRESDYS